MSKEIRKYFDVFASSIKLESFFIKITKLQNTFPAFPMFLLILPLMGRSVMLLMKLNCQLYTANIKFLTLPKDKPPAGVETYLNDSKIFRAELPPKRRNNMNTEFEKTNKSNEPNKRVFGWQIDFTNIYISTQKKKIMLKSC